MTDDDLPPDVPPSLAVHELTREQYARVREALARAPYFALAVEWLWGGRPARPCAWRAERVYGNAGWHERWRALQRWIAADPFLAREAPSDERVDTGPCASDDCRDPESGACDDTCWSARARRLRAEARAEKAGSGS